MAEEKRSLKDEIGSMLNKLNKKVDEFQKSGKLDDLTAQLQEQVEKAQAEVKKALESEEVQKLKQDLKETWEKEFKSGKVQEEIEEGILSALKEIDEGIENLMKSLEEKRKQQEEGGAMAPEIRTEEGKEE